MTSQSRSSPQKPVLAWAIKAPDGDIMTITIRRLKAGTVKKAEQYDWSEEKGYRCVRVLIQEMPHD